MGGVKFTGANRFYKVMMPGFNHKLNLPQKLCNKLTQESLPEQAVLTSCMGTFQIKVCRNQELGLIIFEQGWPEFVHSHGLCIGDFVMFEHIANLHFNSFVFDSNACEKDYPLIVPKKEPQEAPQSDKDYLLVVPKEEPQEAPMRKQIVESSGMRATFESKNPFFVQTIRHSHTRQNLAFPAQFRRSSGIEEGTKKVILRDPRGRKRSVTLCFDKTGIDRCRIGQGWIDFYVGNKLKVGDVCVFELIPNTSNNVVIDVHIFPALSDPIFPSVQKGTVVVINPMERS